MTDDTPCTSPGCTETASIDRSRLPPKQVNKIMLIHYKCPVGHEFVRRVPLK